MPSRSSRTASEFGLASLSLGGAHALEDDDEECEWFPSLSLGTHGKLLGGIHCQQLFRDDFCDAPRRWSQRHPWLAQFDHDKHLCVAHQQLYDPFSSARIFDNWACTATSRDRCGRCTHFVERTLAEVVVLQPSRQLGEPARQHHRWHVTEGWRWFFHRATRMHSRNSRHHRSTDGWRCTARCRCAVLKVGATLLTTLIATQGVWIVSKCPTP